MTGNQYADLIATYLVVNFEERGLDVYRETLLGKTIIGKNRRLDIFAVERTSNRALGLECKYQERPGTVDEKIPYALADLDAIAMPAGLVYAGEGFSRGILDMLAAAPKAAYCLPDVDHWRPGLDTRELDHMLAVTFGWWDLVVGGKSKFSPTFDFP